MRDKDSGQYRIHLARCGRWATVPWDMLKNRIFAKVPARIQEIKRQNRGQWGEKKAGFVPFWAVAVDPRTNLPSPPALPRA
jgi:hypothetical protein